MLLRGVINRERKHTTNIFICVCPSTYCTYYRLFIVDFILKYNVRHLHILVLIQKLYFFHVFVGVASLNADKNVNFPQKFSTNKQIFSAYCAQNLNVICFFAIALSSEFLQG
jgi:hypothetical protein